MFMTNLPDEVMIPDMLLDRIEVLLQYPIGNTLGEDAKSDALMWVRSSQNISPYLKGFWRRHIRTNIISCKTYGVPECVRFFTYVYQLIEELW